MKIARFVGGLLTSILVPFAYGATDNSDPVVTQKAPRMERSESVMSSVNPTVGTVLSDVSGLRNSTPIFGYQVGATLDFGHSHFVFETGLLYSQAGAKYTRRVFSTNNDAELDLSYIDVPLIAKYYVSGQESNSFFIEGGLVPQFLAGKSLQTTTFSTGNPNFVSNFDLGLQVGLGERWILSDKTSFILTATYLRGLTNINPTNRTTLTNSVFGLTGGLGVNL